jgi:hypothetical protein
MNARTQVTNKDGSRRWAPVTVNVDDHIIVPTLDVEAGSDSDQVVEDYVASLVTLPMDWSRPLWEMHVLDLPTSEATSTVVVRMHHSLGDGVSLITLLLASTRSAADPTRLPDMGKHQQQPASASSSAAGFLASAWSYLILAWNTVVGVAYFAATMMFLRDPHLFRRREDKATSFQPATMTRRFVHRTISLDDIKFVKNAINCVSYGQARYSLLLPLFKRNNEILTSFFSLPMHI